MDEAKKEQIKLTATYMNTVAAGLMVAGVAPRWSPCCSAS